MPSLSNTPSHSATPTATTSHPITARSPFPITTTTTTNTTATPITPATATATPIPPFPPPQTFDILPALHTLLSRLQQHNNQQQQQSTNGAAGADTSANAPLDLKDLVTEANSLKIRIQKAKAAVDVLPDMDRTLTEQEGEIVELEGRMGELRELLTELGRRARTDG